MRSGTATTNLCLYGPLPRLHHGLGALKILLRGFHVLAAVSKGLSPCVCRVPVDREMGSR